MQKDAMFRGCTRPPMFMGVPYVPFFIGAGGCILLAIYFNLFWLLLSPVVIFVMRQMARRDEMFFRLIGLRFLFRLRVSNVRDNDGAWVFTPNIHRRQSRVKE